MSKKVKGEMGKVKSKNTCYKYKGGYISYDPTSMTEHYTNKGF